MLPDIGECSCANPGNDDGEFTCWTHHVCASGSCTHIDDEEDLAPIISELREETN